MIKLKPFINEIAIVNPKDYIRLTEYGISCYHVRNMLFNNIHVLEMGDVEEKLFNTNSKLFHSIGILTIFIDEGVINVDKPNEKYYIPDLVKTFNEVLGGDIDVRWFDRLKGLKILQ